MQNLHPSNITVIFQRPSCDDPYRSGISFIAGTATDVDATDQHVFSHPASTTQSTRHCEACCWLSQYFTVTMVNALAADVVYWLACCVGL